MSPTDLGLHKAAYSVNEALYVLSLGRTSFYAAIQKGEIKPLKFGKKTLIPASEIAGFLNRLREKQAV